MNPEDLKDELLKRKEPPCLGESPETSSNDEDNSVKEIVYIDEDSESEPEFDCDIWDDDCRVLDIVIEPLLHPIGGFHLMPTCFNDPDVSNKSKKMKLVPEIREDLNCDAFNKSFQMNWCNDEKFTSNNTELIVDPFKVCVIQDFIQSPKILDDLRQEFNKIDWNVRSMDLYEFFQSEDLKNLNKCTIINQLYDFLKEDVRKWLSHLTGYNLTHISATCSYYSNTDYLLVHDDLRGDRMVAFVLYFTQSHEWTHDKGGALQLLDRDQNGQPNQTVRDIYPSHNQFVFFPVTNKSYHQVAEVTSLGDCRFSINGWFHTDKPPVFKSVKYQPHSANDGLTRGREMDLDLNSWISEDYLSDKIIEQIQQYFEENSEISLKHFLNDWCFQEITRIIQSGELKWVKVGPPNRLNYEVLDEDNLPETLNRFVSLFKSRQFFNLLHRYTDLDLHKIDASSMRLELQKWTPGCYTLLSDYDWSEIKELDLTFYLGCGKSNNVIGGRTQYVTIDEELQSALITLEPEENYLNLVYRDTARFTKYFSKQSKCRCFYKLMCSYRE